MDAKTTLYRRRHGNPGSRNSGNPPLPSSIFYATRHGDGVLSRVWRIHACPLTPLTATEMSNLLAKWGAPGWRRLKSYNYPDRYVRHQNNVGRVDVYPFDPYQDQMWTLVPGLADASGVSFRSVNYPTMYLRQSSYSIVLNTDDNSSTVYQLVGRALGGHADVDDVARDLELPAVLSHGDTVTGPVLRGRLCTVSAAGLRPEA